MPTLLELVETRVALKRSGRKFWGCCPFHGEKTPSFKVEQYRGKWRYHCFSCGERGDAIDWLMHWDRLTFREASERIGQPIRRDLEAQKQIAEARRKALVAYRDQHPDCECPDWLIST